MAKDIAAKMTKARVFTREYMNKNHHEFWEQYGKYTELSVNDPHDIMFYKKSARLENGQPFDKQDLDEMEKAIKKVYSSKLTELL